MKQLKIIVEKHAGGYVAYPVGIKGVVVGQGDSYEEALSDVKSAIRSHVETFGEEVLEPFMIGRSSQPQGEWEAP